MKEKDKAEEVNSNHIMQCLVPYQDWAHWHDCTHLDLCLLAPSGLFELSI